MLQSRHKQELDMKHKIVVALCLVAVITTGLATAQAYVHYHNQVNAKNAQMASTNKADQRKEALRQKLFAQELANLKAQCAKDLSAYNALPAVQKLHAQVPTCTPNLVQ